MINSHYVIVSLLHKDIIRIFFSYQVKKCEDGERIVRYIETLLIKFNVEIVKIPGIDSFVDN
jgi:hypothetical protein